MERAGRKLGCTTKVDDRAIRETTPPEGKKFVRLYAGKGLCIEIHTNGGRYWRLKYRHGGKEKRISLGVYPAVSIARACILRDQARKLIAKGLDPSAVRKEEKAARRVEQAAAIAEAESRDRPERLRLALRDDGGLSVDDGRRVLILSADDVAHLRAFLDATKGVPPCL